MYIVGRAKWPIIDIPQAYTGALPAYITTLLRPITAAFQHIIALLLSITFHIKDFVITKD
jgi:hypothetical protein